MTLDESMVGARVIVRSLVPGEVGPSGRPAMTDVIGRVLAIETEHATIERRDGTLVDVRLDDIVTAKRVPDGPSRVRTRPAMDFTAEDLARICTRGWPPIESEPLGEWTLRAADGFTGRANSAAIHGEPGMDFPAALERIEAFYAARDLPAKAQVIDGSRWADQFQTARWRGIGGTHDHAIVQVADLRDVLAFVRRDDPGVEVRGHVDDDWLELYGRAATGTPGAARAVLEGTPTVGFVRIGDPAVAIGRVAVTGEWAGMSCVEVAPAERGRGLGRRIVDASLEWAARHGADKAYLQTTRDNHAALALYARYGFADHHRYHYVAP